MKSEPGYSFSANRAHPQRSSPPYGSSPQPGRPSTGQRTHIPGTPPPYPPATSPPRRYPISSQKRPAKRQPLRCGCLFSLLGAVCLLFAVFALYLIAPGRINVLLIGIDYAPHHSNLARSDTIMLLTVVPQRPYVGLLSIPRDLWVKIPQVGENRINTAHFFAEARQPGSGPKALRQTIAENFGVDAPYYVRLRFEGFRQVVDALGGVEITLDRPMAGYPAGNHFLNGNKALAFVRHRSGTDDFYRMGQGQLMFKALLKTAIQPQSWPRWPAVALAAWQAVDSNLPPWLWPRLAFTLLRVGTNGIDSRVISREMTTPFVTNEGANVLLPNWPLILALVATMFTP